MNAYYNEIDPYAAEFLRNLINNGHVAPGVVDERDVRDVSPSNLSGFTQCHFFAGVGIWSYAFRLAGWGDDKPAWTASCPCQPFSAAGAGLGIADERHLWPVIDWLAEQCRPETIFGEQVASLDGLNWFDIVSSDMEAADYAIGAVDTCAAGFGAPHIRQRLYFVAEDQRFTADRVADASSDRAQFIRCDDGEAVGVSEVERAEQRPDVHQRSGTSVRMGNPDGRRQPGSWEMGRSSNPATGKVGKIDRDVDDGGDVRLADAKGTEREQSGAARAGRIGASGDSTVDRTSAPNGPWGNADWLHCRDGKWRPVEPGTFPLAHGAASRVGRLRAYGNGLCAEQAAGFIRAYMERDMVDLKQAPAGNLFEWGIS